MTAEQRVRAAAPMRATERRMVWAWAWTGVRPYVGWFLAAAGTVALFVGWFGVSGESLTAKQLPYLVSAGLSGIALFIMAGVFMATDDVRRQFARISELERKVDDLYSLFVADLGSPAGAAGAAVATAGPGSFVALPAGTSYHRPGCGLVTGKSNATTATADDISARGLRPCRVCDPGPAR